MRRRAADPMDPKYAGQDEGSLAYLAANPVPAQIPASAPSLEVEQARSHDVWTVCVLFRVVNAFALCTFFQPDEYYQALEPAWQLAFGPESGAWITWVRCPGLWYAHGQILMSISCRNGAMLFAHLYSHCS